MCVTGCILAHFVASWLASVLNITRVIGKRCTKQLGHNEVCLAEQYTIWIIRNKQNLFITYANI